MSFLRSVWSDLVEKRLWPVALALLVALVAVPVLLGSASGAETASVAGATKATGATTAADGLAQVTLQPTVPVRRNRDGTLRNPFKQRGAARPGGGSAPSSITAPTTAGQNSTAPAGGGAPVSGSTIGAGSATGTGTTGDTGPAKRGGPATTEAPKPGDDFVAQIRFGRSDGRHERKTIERLTPLPEGDSPFLVFLGVLSDRQTAVFLLSSDVTATGDGSCRPRASSCETVELRAGDSELLEVTAADGSTRSYDLELVRVARDNRAADVALPSVQRPETVAARAGGKAKAQPKSELSPTDGSPSADDPASADDGSDRYRFDKVSGLLRRVAATSALGAHAAARTAAGEGFKVVEPPALRASTPTP